MQYEFLFLGKTKESYLAAGIADFSKRLSHYAEVKIKVLKDCRWRKDESPEKIMEKEADAFLGALAGQTVIVALDRGGRQLDSEGLAEQIGKWEESGARHVSFLIGGALGLAPSIRKRAALEISLSRLTFTHEMTRLILLEQMYRAHTIRAGEKYHK